MPQTASIYSIIDCNRVIGEKINLDSKFKETNNKVENEAVTKVWREEERPATDSFSLDAMRQLIATANSQP
jgi:hypothetical protein